MRAVILEEATWFSLNRSGELLALILHSTAYFVLGLLVFRWGYRTARQKGILAHY
jgi:hypothetical protein